MIIAPELRAELLNRWPVGRLATVRADGRPHLVPVVFCAIDEVIYSPLDAKRKSSRNLQRFDNVAANPSASLLIDDYDDDWDALWWVRIDGRADRFEPDTDMAQQLADRLAGKYPQYRRLPPLPGQPVYLRIRAEKVSAWAQSGSADVIAERLVYLATQSR